MEEPDGPQGRAIVCPRCRKLTAEDGETCFHCGGRLSRSVRLGETLRKGFIGFDFTLATAGVCVVLYAVSVVYSHLHGYKPVSVSIEFLPQLVPSYESLYLFGMQETAAVWRGEVWRLLTSVFVHLGVVHIFFNLLWLNFLGRTVEGDFGAARYVVIFTASGLASSGGSLLFGIGGGGASGAVCGLLGAAAVYGHLRGGEYGHQLKRSMLFWAAFILLMGCAIPNINNVGHLFGLLGGAATGYLVYPGRKVFLWGAGYMAILAMVLIVGATAAMIASIPSSRTVLARQEGVTRLTQAAAFNHPDRLSEVRTEAGPAEFPGELKARAEALRAIHTPSEEGRAVRDRYAGALETLARHVRGRKGDLTDTDVQPLWEAYHAFARWQNGEVDAVGFGRAAD